MKSNMFLVETGYKILSTLSSMPMRPGIGPGSSGPWRQENWSTN
jgi:hypothetical protein